MKALLLSCLILCSITVSAQLCTGSLGDPVVNIDFGSGTADIGPELPAGTTTYNFWNRNFPQDGYYTIAHTSGGTEGRWFVTDDHTRNPGGYMMVVNASTSLSDYFYQKTVSGLCENTKYEFAAWVMNLISSSNDISPPDIIFTIERTTGGVLGTFRTGPISKTDVALWRQFGLFFQTPAGVTDVVIRMKNNSPGGSPANDLALDDITFRPCGPEMMVRIDVADRPVSLDVCIGNNAADYRLQADISSGYHHPDYQWQLNFNDQGWVNIAGATATDVIVHPLAAGRYLYRLSAGEAGALSSCRAVSNVSMISIVAPPVILASNSGPACVGGSVSLGGVMFIPFGVYQWTGPNGFAFNGPSPVLTNLTLTDAGVYTLKLTTPEGCVATGSTTVTVNPAPVVTVSGDAEVCEGTGTVLHASGGQSYLWSPATGLSDNTVADPVASPLTTTVYTVTISNNGLACRSSARVTVKVLKNAAVFAGPDKTIINGNKVQLEGTVSGGNIRHFWTPADNLSDASLLNPVATPERTTTYTLHAVSDAGCIGAEDEMTVTVNEKIVIPNTFSPNGDGINDVWNIAGLDTYAKPAVTIFNRYGSQVYKSVGYATPWNGTNNGDQLPVGTYYYVIDMKNNTPVLSGWIWLTR